MSSVKLKSYDLFLSYAVEDRDMVEALYKILTEKGLRVWYANRQLEPGRYIQEDILKGIESSRYGVALISHNYNGYWPQFELSLLIQLKNKFIPVLHEISIRDTGSINPDLSKRFCINTEKGAEDVAEKITKKILRRRTPAPIRRTLLKTGLYLSVVIVLIYSLYRWINTPPDKIIEGVIIRRGTIIQKISMQRAVQNIASTNSQLINTNALQQTLGKMKQAFPFKSIIDSFIVHNGISEWTDTGYFKEEAIKLMKMINSPELIDYRLYQSKPNPFEENNSIQYFLFNMKHIHYKVKGRGCVNNLYEVRTEYQNTIRLLEVKITADEHKRTWRRIIHIWALPQEEIISFKKDGSNWETILPH